NRAHARQTHAAVLTTFVIRSPEAAGSWRRNARGSAFNSMLSSSASAVGGSTFASDVSPRIWFAVDLDARRADDLHPQGHVSFWNTRTPWGGVSWRPRAR